VVAGGSGVRFGGLKQFANLGGREVVEWSLVAASSTCVGCVLVVPPQVLEEAAAKFKPLTSAVVAGGVTRAASVRSGLAAVPEEAEVIVVHDAARPLATAALWQAVVAAVKAGADAAVPCLAVSDTIKQRGPGGALVTLDRSRLVAAQTPQAFSAKALRAAHLGAPEATDDAALVEAGGGKVVEVTGEASNLKLTGPTDLALAEALLARVAL
jgi:2-C-methyl-D-erythritol 4-phosphate cytidylyltransferase